MFERFQSFIAKVKASLRRIAAATRGEKTIEDLENDAYVIAAEIGQKRNRPIDFSNSEDGDLVIRALGARNGKWGDWKLRKAVRIDQEPDDDAAFGWADRLAATPSSDPLISLLAREVAVETDMKLAASYSQATAYVMIFVRFKNNREEVCAYLVISPGTLARRVAQAVAVVRVQPSLFDGIERIAESFMPLKGRDYAVRVEKHRDGLQLVWAFDDA